MTPGELALLADQAEFRSQAFLDCERASVSAVGRDDAPRRCGDGCPYRRHATLRFAEAPGPAREVDSIVGSELLEVDGCDWKLETRGHPQMTSLDIDDDLSHRRSRGQLGNGFTGLRQRKARRYAWSQLATLIPL